MGLTAGTEAAGRREELPGGCWPENLRSTRESHEEEEA